ncbi:MAG: N-acetyl sugar amidotransferase [Sterolibacteriaceae bacterium MAG5]|nr:N-acetyl sugar amidotransferase [Candidatus Nitricoxidireducens bremensis]
MRYCKSCIMPDTRPEIVFDENGVCDACLSHKKKESEVDWQARETEFLKILDRYRRSDGYYDCIVPVSGGKDSCYQAYTMKTKYGMNPLCVNFVPCEMTDVGQKNLVFLRDLGFDLLQIGSNRSIYRRMSKIGFERLGDCCWPEHIGIFTAPIRVAVNYKIPLVIWGENPQLEYGGPAAERESRTLRKGWLEEFQMLGYRISDLLNEGFSEKDLYPFLYPSDEELAQVGVTGLYLGYFTKWDGRRNMEHMVSLGWNRNPDGPCEGTYTDYENLDCKWVGGLHDYLKFLKYGYGRATDNACIDIRFGRMERLQGFKLAKQYEGSVPRRYLKDFLDFVSIDEASFFSTLDRFTNKYLFKRGSDGQLIRNEHGDVIKLDYGFEE